MRHGSLLRWYLSRSVVCHLTFRLSSNLGFLYLLYFLRLKFLELKFFNLSKVGDDFAKCKDKLFSIAAIVSEACALKPLRVGS